MPHRLNRSTYEKAGIKIVDHFFKRDEYWWNGNNIGSDNATAVGLFVDVNNRQPKSVEEAVNWYENYKPPKRNPRARHRR